MAGFATLTAINDALLAGKFFRVTFGKHNISTGGANTWLSWWKTTGYPLAGSDPTNHAGGGTSYNSDTVGALNFGNVSTATKHLLMCGGSASVSLSLMFYDRLTAVGGTSLASVANVDAVTPTLPRYSGTDARYVQPWLEFTTALGTAVTLNLRYTNDSGTGSRQGDSLTIQTAGGVVNAMVPLPLQSGDRGIRTTTSLDITSASSAGVANLTLIRPLAYVYLPGNTWHEEDYAPFFSDLMRIYDGAQIGIAFLSSGSNTPACSGSFKVVWA